MSDAETREYETDTVRRRAIVSGVVQGVGFRWSARSVALDLGISGFARNRSDATVEVEAQGPPAAVDQFLEWLRHGPPGASVSSVTVSSVDVTEVTVTSVAGTTQDPAGSRPFEVG